MECWITLVLVASASACQTYSTNDCRQISVGDVPGIGGLSPWGPEEIDTSFVIHDQEHLDSPERVLSWNATFDPHDSLLSCGDKLELIIHGLAASTKKPWVQELKDAVIERDPRTKVVLVDWSKGATKSESADGTSDRLQAANNALMVGRVVACFVQRIISTYGVPEESVHIFGHSMGAQIMGQAATWLSESSRIRIGKGTASEASSRPFEEHGIYPERADVRFMLAMHTTAAPDSPEEQLGGALGISKAFAHVDLYPNRGKLIQPGCKKNFSDSCSHDRSHIYLEEMVTRCTENCDFRGSICNDEKDAINGLCSNRTVDVCAFIRNREVNVANSDENHVVLTFDTDMDKLRVICEL